jgi:hypothetical protein
MALLEATSSTESGVALENRELAVLKTFKKSSKKY